MDSRITKLAKVFRKDRINVLDFSAVIFTSRTSVDHYFRICEELRITVPDSMKYFCVSEATAFYLQKYIVYRKRKIFFGKSRFEDLLEILEKHKETLKYKPSLQNLYTFVSDSIINSYQNPNSKDG